MSNLDLIILSYHRFTVSEEEYVFSRTYRQFRSDIETKVFDWITIDDGHRSQIKACKMMQESNIRAKLFINPGLVGTGGYCSWVELKELALCHDIENHSLDHVDLVAIADAKDIYYQIIKAHELIAERIGRPSRYFVPPWNHYDNRVEAICEEHGIQLIKKRFNVQKDTL